MHIDLTSLTMSGVRDIHVTITWNGGGAAVAPGGSGKTFIYYSTNGVVGRILEHEWY